MDKAPNLEKLKFFIGFILAVASLCGFLFTFVAVGPNGPHGGVTPLILVPYAVMVLGCAAYLILRDIDL